MAKPRVFVSSTYYDLKHLRSALDLFIESLGFESVLSEKGDIAFTPDVPLDESCYREAANADILVLIIGGRYGGEAGGRHIGPTPGFFEKYESITRKEYESAVSRDIPIYLLIESSVYSEYQTYLRNKGQESVKYAHVDSVNVFRLIDDILNKPRNNPMHTFERFSEIESWLREQWAGYFRELLQRETQERQLSVLAAQIAELLSLNETLRKYLEAVMTGSNAAESRKLIESEKRRLEEAERNERIKGNRFCQYVMSNGGIEFADFLTAIGEATSFADLGRRIGRLSKNESLGHEVTALLSVVEDARSEFNKMRSLLGLERLESAKE